VVVDAGAAEVLEEIGSWVAVGVADAGTEADSVGSSSTGAEDSEGLGDSAGAEEEGSWEGSGAGDEPPQLPVGGPKLACERT